ncbi:MAG: hypothetical protein V1798_09250 [Pseudomonadota bacterium]
MLPSPEPADTIRAFQKRKLLFKRVEVVAVILFAVGLTMPLWPLVGLPYEHYFPILVVLVVFPLFLFWGFFCACPRCKKRALQLNAVACPRCGARLSDQAPKSEPEPEAKKLEDPYFFRAEIARRRVLKKRAFRLLWTLVGLFPFCAFWLSWQVGVPSMFRELSVAILISMLIVLTFIALKKLVACPFCHKPLIRDYRVWWRTFKKITTCELCGADVRDFVAGIFAKN